MLEQRPRSTLIVEDDPGMRDYYSQLFAGTLGGEFAAAIAADGETAIDILRRDPVDLILLDWTLPGISGEYVLRAVRASPRTRSIGVMMVTGKCTLDDEVRALESGADDHLAKPFDENVLLARLRSLSRRRDLMIARRRESPFSGLTFDPEADLVRVEGHRVRLTPREMGLLGIFRHEPDILHSHAHLWETLWGYETRNWEHLLIVTLASLRRKLGAQWGARLKCRKGEGYVFESPS